MSGEMTVPLALISSMATRQILSRLASEYESETGQTVRVESVGGVDAARRVSEGEAFDIVVLGSDALAKLAQQGHVDAGSRADVARSGIAAAVAADARQPRIDTEEALRDAILQSRSIGYSTGPSGVHLEKLFARWGIADTIAPKIVQARPGLPVATLIAQGEVELGFQQNSELLDQPGIAILGPLPEQAQAVTVFAAALCAKSSRGDAVKAFLSFLVSPRTRAVKLAHGMEPA